MAGMIACIPQPADLVHRCSGGGYTKHNVARCWAAETAVLVDQPIAEELPHNAYYEYYAPGYRCATPEQDAVLLARKCKRLLPGYRRAPLPCMCRAPP